MSSFPSFTFERAWMARGMAVVAGVDEAGAGAWAGPVVAAAAIVPLASRLAGIRDSKLLSPAQRQELAEVFAERGVVSAVGLGSVEEIAAHGLRWANLAAMRRAVEALAVRPDAVLVDWYHVPGLSQPQQAIRKGDRLAKSIAAASIVAKVTRDRMMAEFDRQHPGYGFSEHKGYGTDGHRAALKALGPCPIHRMTFAPLKLF